MIIIKNKFQLSKEVTILAISCEELKVSDIVGRKCNLIHKNNMMQSFFIDSEYVMCNKTLHANEMALRVNTEVLLSVEDATSGEWQLERC